MVFRLMTSLSRMARPPYLRKSSSSFMQNHTTFLPNIYMTRHFASVSPDIASYEEVKELPTKPGVLLIDVREPQELLDTGIVPTSINIPLGEVKQKLSSEFSEDEFKKLYKRNKPVAESPIIFMCKIGGRSGKALDIAKQLGFKNGRNYLGSWEEWKVKEKLPK